MNGIHFSIQLTTPEFIAERGSVSCSSKKTSALKSWEKGTPLLSLLRVKCQKDMGPVSAYIMGICTQSCLRDLTYFLKPNWAHSPIHSVTSREWENSKHHFFMTQGKKKKTTTCPCEGHGLVLLQFLKTCVKAGMQLCLGRKLHNWTSQCGLLGCLLQELIPHLVLSPSCLFLLTSIKEQP